MVRIDHPSASPVPSAQIVFASDRAGNARDLYVVNRDGSGERRLTFDLFARAPSGLSGESRLSTAPRAPYSDTFDRGAVDTSFWYTLVDLGSSLAVQNGRLVESIAGTDADWRLLFSADGNTGEAIPQVSLFAQAATFGHEDGSVGWGNFRINSGQLSCPSWWSDSWPDAGPAASA